MLRLPLGEEITTMFIRSNRQTDGQTDRIAISISSDKNVTLFISQTLTNFYNIWNITYRVNFLQHNNSKYCCCTTSGKDNYIFQQDNVPPERAGSSYYQHETHSSGLMTSEQSYRHVWMKQEAIGTFAMKFWIQAQVQTVDKPLRYCLYSVFQ